MFLRRNNAFLIRFYIAAVVLKSDLNTQLLRKTIVFHIVLLAGKLANKCMFSMFLLVITFIISMLDLLLKPVMGILKQRSGTDDEIRIIDAQLKNISEQDDFVTWARLTRKRQQLQQQLAKESVEYQKTTAKIASVAQNISRTVIFLLFRKSAIVTLDDTLAPVWFLKLASYSGFSFIRFGDVSCFMWFFCHGILDKNIHFRT